MLARWLPALVACALALAALPASAGIPVPTDVVQTGPLPTIPAVTLVATCERAIDGADVGVAVDYGQVVDVCLDENDAGDPCLSAYDNGVALSRTCADHDAEGNLCASAYLGNGEADRTCAGRYAAEGSPCVGHSDLAAGEQVDDHACLGQDEQPSRNPCAVDDLFLNGVQAGQDRTCAGAYPEGSPCVAHRATLLGIPVEDRLCGFTDPATGHPWRGR